MFLIMNMLQVKINLFIKPKELKRHWQEAKGPERKIYLCLTPIRRADGASIHLENVRLEIKFRNKF